MNSRRTSPSTTKTSPLSQGQITKQKIPPAAVKTTKRLGSLPFSAPFSPREPSAAALTRLCFLLSSHQNLNSSGKSTSSSDGPKFPGDKSSTPSNNNQQKKGIQVLPDGENIMNGLHLLVCSVLSWVSSSLVSKTIRPSQMKAAGSSVLLERLDVCC